MILVSRLHACFYTLLCGLAYLQISTANTEILNFEPRPQSIVPSFDRFSWTPLNASQNKISIQIEPDPFDSARSGICNDEDYNVRCKHQRWFGLDLDDPKWSNYNSFTFRLSWPASLPTDFDIKIGLPDDLYLHDDEPPSGQNEVENGTTSRLAFVRVTALDTGVRSPHHQLSAGEQPNVALNIVLEPLLLGLLPTDMIPVLFFLFLNLSVASLLTPIIFRYLRHISEQAKRELDRQRKTM